MNYCHVYATVAKGEVICISAMDNPVKGASDLAVRYINVICSLDENLGLE
jgi:N-acetyl-gamma-glutamylphosphate reductase